MPFLLYHSTVITEIAQPAKCQDPFSLMSPVLWIQVNWAFMYVISLQGWRQSWQHQVYCQKKEGAVGKLSREYTPDTSPSHPIWLPRPGDVFSEPGSIYFPITAAVPVEWPICLSRRAGHARLAWMPCGEDRDKERGFYIDANAPSGYTSSTVKFTNGCCQSQFMVVSVTKLSVLTTAASTKLLNSSLARCESKKCFLSMEIYKQQQTLTGL